MPTRGERACSLSPERSLSYAKIMPTRAMRACSYIAECSLSYAKLIILLMSSLFI